MHFSCNCQQRNKMQHIYTYKNPIWIKINGNLCFVEQTTKEWERKKEKDINYCMGDNVMHLQNLHTVDAELWCPSV